MIPIAYNARNLVVRKTTTIAAALGIGLVVFVVAGVLMLTHGIERTLGRAASPDRVVVMRKGSETEMSSGFEVTKAGLVLASAGVARSSDGKPFGAGELLVVILLPKRGTSGESNVQVRGIVPESLSVRSEMRIVEGRAAKPGTDEAMVGKALRGRFEGLDLGGSFELKKSRPVTVVGFFEANGSSLESEVWADADTVRTAFGRPGYVSSVHARLESPDKYDAFRAAIEENPQLDLVVMRETTYYEKASEGTTLFVKLLSWLVTVFFLIGAIIGAMITMYGSVANRTREIGTLRALGFSRMSIVLSFLLESVLLALAGGAVGATAALGLTAVHFSIINFSTWSEVVFSFEPTAGILAKALVVAGAMGVLGGLAPAVRASRMSPVTAMRG